MPKYLYKCTACNMHASFFHSMSETFVDCASCGEDGVLVKIPAKFNFSKEKGDNKSSTGSVVKTSIEEFKKDLRDQKKDMTSKDYEYKTD
jgi:hypothetical protein